MTVAVEMVLNSNANNSNGCANPGVWMKDMGTHKNIFQQIELLSLYVRTLYNTVLLEQS